MIGDDRLLDCVQTKADRSHNQQVISGLTIDRPQRVDDLVPRDHLVRRRDLDAVGGGPVHIEIDQRPTAVACSALNLGKRPDQLVASRNHVALKRDTFGFTDDGDVVHHGFDHVDLVRPRRREPENGIEDEAGLNFERHSPTPMPHSISNSGGQPSTVCSERPTIARVLKDLDEHQVTYPRARRSAASSLDRSSAHRASSARDCFSRSSILA